jgi:putative (di)nucleoside polyphosphate hydrolase
MARNNNENLIDRQGFRANVGIVVADGQGRVLWARRCGQNAWQFPQGGIHAGETPEQAMYRELDEEIGLQPEDVKLVAQTQGWLRYKLPEGLIRKNSNLLLPLVLNKWLNQVLLT